VTCDLAHASESCSTGTCTLTSCDAGWANVDGSSANGCECAIESPEAGGTCAAAQSLGTFSDTPTTDQTVSGKLTSSSDIDCYTFSASDTADTTCDAFNVDIRFTANPSTQFQFNVYRGNCSTQVCATTTDSYNWYVDYAGACVNPTGTAPCGECGCRVANTLGYNLCINDTATYTFCVSRRGGFPVTCDTYSVRVTNGVF
jgi:hypothetical protein